ncbi:transcriptional regulator [Streptomyces sp. NPDC058045]|uniref:transcriptional regulator n=1 Tax=Streptomyces sp. NPDC058045 TaxID=3346311 RepID=UPI0036E38BD6
MYDLSTRQHALRLVEQGRSLNSVSKETGVSRSAIRSWLVRIEPHMPQNLCARCRNDPPSPADAYSYLLGLYLGDGNISENRRGVYALRIACADAYPGLITACEQAILAVHPHNRVCRVQKPGCVAVTSWSKHWPCLFPQHGPGKKHERPIVLEEWQRVVVDAHPWEFIRGLIHSDGCRITNWTTRMVAGERKRYEYPRYFFTNKSDDIRRLFTDTLDAVGVGWTTLARGSAPFNVSVARRDAVALLDARVGPKS